MATNHPSVPVVGAETSVYRPKRRQAEPDLMTGAGRRAWYDRANAAIGDAVKKFGGPHLYAALVGSDADPAVRAEVGSGRGGLLNALAEFTPGADVRDLQQGSADLSQGVAAGDPLAATAGGGMMAAALLGITLPGSAGGVRDVTEAAAGASKAAGRVRPATDNLQAMLNSNFSRGRVLGEETVPINSLKGSISAAGDNGRRVEDLQKQISGPDGYIARLVVDADGNVLEGAHRLEALRRLGVEDVPIVRLGEAWEGLPVARMRKALIGSGLKAEQRDEVLANVADMVRDAGSAKAALEEYDLPVGDWGNVYRSVLEAIDAPAPGIRAYHGSPHDFDRFSLDKIGTGEGAQSYGHGLYFAENEAVAREYRRKLSGPASVELFGQDFEQTWPMELQRLARQGEISGPSKARIEQAIRSATIAGRDPVEQLRGIQKYEMRRMIAAGEPQWSIDYQKDAHAKALAFMERAAPKVKQSGRMYEVEIGGSPEAYLDWDKPVGQQSEPLRKMLREVAQTYGMADPTAGDNAGRSVMTFMTELSHAESAGSTGAAARALREVGVPGIRYGDQLSRGPMKWTLQSPAENTTGKWRVKQFGGANARTFDSEDEARAFIKENGPTSNFVVFDDNFIDIVRKYGLAGLTGAGAGGAALAGSAGDAEASEQ